MDWLFSFHGGGVAVAVGINRGGSMSGTARMCQRCGTAIPAERIEAMPETRICVQCSKEIGDEFDVTVTPVNTAKAGSLKKNYGSWTIRKRRREIRPKE